ncbi:MAG: flavoprotein [Candidatus Altiarchaeota archaeon]
MRVLWCITGGEYLLAESASILEGLDDVTVIFSAAGEEVSRMYGQYERIVKAASEVVLERKQGRSTPALMSLNSYDLVIVAPCTGNTVAKVVHGIGDSVVSNVVCQALKSGIRVIVLPTDSTRNVTGKSLSGRDVHLKCRAVDLENVKKLKKEVKVVRSAQELAAVLSKIEQKTTSL